MAFAMLCSFFFGIVAGWKLHLLFPAKISKTRSVYTESQCRYAYSRTEPRFVPNPEREQGVWLGPMGEVKLG